MRLRPVGIEIPSDEPFKNDLLKRKGYAQNLTTFVKALNEPCVMALDSTWGTGKTTFIKMWQQQLEKEGVPTIYFNAWENDFASDPFVSLVSEIGTSMEQYCEADSAAEKYYRKVKEHGADFLKSSIPLAVKVLTTGLVDEAAVEKIAGGYASEEFTRYREDKKTIKKFKEALGKFVREVRGEVSDKALPLVFFIDELDRCRPLYAIRLLERVKHLFDATGIIFVLSLDQQQLGHSLRSIYGNGMDDKGYLRRFFDFTYHLPKPDYEEFCEMCFSRFELNEYLDSKVGETKYAKGNLQYTLPDLCQMFGMSLRDIEKCFTLITICCMSTPDNHFLFGDLLAILVVLKIMDDQAYRRYTTGNMERDEILSMLKGKEGGSELILGDKGAYLEAAIVLGLPSGKYEQCQAEYHTIMNDEGSNEIDRSRATTIMHRIEMVRVRGMMRPTSYLTEKINLAQNFLA